MPNSDVLPSVVPATIGGVVATGIIILCRTIYEKVTQLDKYNKKDLRRHKQLVSLYRRYVNETIPEEWALEGGRPTYAPNFSALAYNFSEEIETIQIPHGSISTSVETMLAIISKLMASLDKRRTGALRKGSIESLFFAELAKWLYEKLPLMDFTSKETLQKIKSVQTFCQEAQEKEVIPMENDQSRNTPKIALHRIIKELDKVVQSTEILIESMTFLDFFRKLDSSFIVLISRAVNFLYFYTQGKHQNEDRIPIDVFIDPTQTNYPKVKEIRSKKLGEWLNKTLAESLGITGGDYRNSKVPTLIDADNYLADEQDLMASERKKDIEAWGLWPVSIMGEKTPFSQLEAIREIHRSILKMYYFRDLIKDIIQVVPTLGNEWLYRDKLGHAVITVLLEETPGCTREFHQAFHQAWDSCKQLFEEIKLKGNMSQDENQYVGLSSATKSAKSFDEEYEKSKKIVESIILRLNESKAQHQKSLDARDHLVRGLVECLEYKKKTNSEAYQILKEALKKHVPQRERAYTAATAAQPSDASSAEVPERARSATINTIPAVTLSPIFGEIEKRLNLVKASRHLDCLDLSDCQLDKLSLNEMGTLFDWLQNDLPETVNKINLRNNQLQLVCREDHVSKLRDWVLRYIPSGITTLDLSGHGFEAYALDKLNELLSVFPTHITHVSLNNEEPLTLAEQRRRRHWPASYYQLMSQGQSKWIEALLHDYTKGEGTTGKWLRFLTLHWNRHHVQDVLKVLEKTDDPQAVQIALNALKRINSKNSAGSLQRRLSFIAHMNTQGPQSSAAQASVEEVTPPEDKGKEHVAMSTFSSSLV